MAIILQSKGIVKSFGGLKALDGVSFELCEGEILGLIGPNGSGKTTLFNVLSGSFTSDSGKVFFRGKDITGFRSDKICRLGIARTFQLNQPFENLNVYENVMVGALFGRKREADSTNLKLLHDNVLEALLDAGLEIKKDFPIGSLTTSELRKLELARAISSRPEVLLLDEVMAGLTQAETEEMMKRIVRIKEDRGITILIIEHIMKAIMGLSDRMIVLNYGKLIAKGLPNEIATNSYVIEVYLGKEGDENSVSS